MAYSYNPITGTFDIDPTGTFYSKEEIDTMVTNLNATIALKLAKNGKNGTFTTVDGKTITVVDGQITNIV